MFYLYCFVYYDLYEHVWVPNMAKGDNFSVYSDLAAPFFQFVHHILSCVWMQYFALL